MNNDEYYISRAKKRSSCKKRKIESLFRLIFKKPNLNILTFEYSNFPVPKPFFSGQVSTIAFGAFSETSGSVTEDALWADSGLYV